MSEEEIMEACKVVTDFMRVSGINSDKVDIVEEHFLERKYLKDNLLVPSDNLDFKTALEKAEMYAGCRPFMDHDVFLEKYTKAWETLNRSLFGRKVQTLKKKKEAAADPKDVEGNQKATAAFDAAEQALAGPYSYSTFFFLCLSCALCSVIVIQS